MWTRGQLRKDHPKPLNLFYWSPSNMRLIDYLPCCKQTQIDTQELYPSPDSNQLTIHQHQTTRVLDQPSTPPGLTTQTFSPCTFILRGVFWLLHFLDFHKIGHHSSMQTHAGSKLLEPAWGSIWPRSLLVSISQVHVSRVTHCTTSPDILQVWLIGFKKKASVEIQTQTLLDMCPVS